MIQYIQQHIRFGQGLAKATLSTYPVFFRNFLWTVCLNGYFISRLYRTQDDLLHNIKEGRCCKPTNLPSSCLLCYEDCSISLSFDNRGWSNCDSGFYLTRIYRGGCDKICCIETFKCCSKSGRHVNCWFRFDKKGWVQCDSSTHYITGGMLIGNPTTRSVYWRKQNIVQLFLGIRTCQRRVSKCSSLISLFLVLT